MLPVRRGLIPRLASGNVPDFDGRVALEPVRRLPDGPVGGADLCLVHDVHVFLDLGVALRRDGSLCHATANQVPRLARRLAWQPGMRRRRDGLRFSPPPGVTSLPSAALWLGAGARANYGHYLDDAMTGLAAMDAVGVLGTFPAISPGLARWQSDLLAAAGLAGIRTLGGGVIHVERLIYATAMNSYLNRADGLLGDLAARFAPTAAVAANPGGKGATYLSRRGFSGRIIVNEAALEAALSARGVRVIRPERMTPAEQISAMAGTGVLIGASGAALANALFLPRGATLVELRPPPVREPWVARMSAALGLQHVVLPLQLLAPSAAGILPRLRQLPRRLAGHYGYFLRAEIAPVLERLPPG